MKLFIAILEAAGADQGTTISPSDPQPTEHGNDGDVTASR